MLAVILTHDLIYCLKNNSNIEQNDHLNNAVATQYCPFVTDTNTVPSSSIALLHGARHKPSRSLDFSPGSEARSRSSRCILMPHVVTNMNTTPVGTYLLSAAVSR